VKVSRRSRENLFGRGGARAFAFPFVVFAETGDVFFHLGFEFGKRGLADGGEMLAFVCGVKRAGGKSEIERETEFFGSRDHGKDTVKLDEVGIKTLEEFV